MKLHFAAVFSLLLVVTALSIVLVFVNWDEAGFEVLSLFGVVAAYVVGFVLLDLVFPKWRSRNHHWVEKMLLVAFLLILIMLEKIFL